MMDKITLARVDVALTEALSAESKEELLTVFRWVAEETGYSYSLLADALDYGFLDVEDEQDAIELVEGIIWSCYEKDF